MEFDFINNIALLISLTIIHRIISYRWFLKGWKAKTFTGLLFGMVAIAGMANSVEVFPGVIFDGRSIILSIAGLFGGPVPALIASVISSVYRIYLGGPGTIMGLSVILSSAFLGVLMYFWLKNRPGKIHSAYYYLFGLAVHIVMVGLTIVLPGKLTTIVFLKVAIPVLLIYPVGTWIVAWLFEKDANYFETLKKFNESELLYKTIFQKSQAVYLLIDPKDGKIKDANQAAVNYYGYQVSELKQLNIREINKQERDEFLTMARKIRKGKDNHFFLQHQLSNGEIRDVEVISAPVIVQGEVMLLSMVEDISKKKLAIEELKRERRLLRTVMDNIPHLVNVKDLNNRRILSNLSEKRFFGYSGNSILGKKDSELFPYPIGEQLEKTDQRVITTGSAVINNEIKYPSGEGNYLWMQTSRVPLRNGNDEITGLVSISRDITHRKKAEAELQELSLVAEKTSNLVIISDVNDKILWANSSFYKRTGYSNKEAEGKSVYELLRGKDTDPAHIRNIKKGIETKEPFRQEILNYTKTGEEIWMDVHVSPVLDNEGNVEKTISICVDISTSKLSENLLRQSLKSYSDLFNSLVEAIFLLDEQGRFIDVNQGAIKMFGYSHPEIIGKSPAFLNVPEKTDAHAVNNAIRNAYQGIHQELEVWARKKNGELFQMEVHLYSSEYHNQKVVLAIAQDITQRKQAEELKSRLEIANKTTKIKQRFLANMSHEMRTPLNGVLGMSEILKATPLNENQEIYIKIIEDSSRSLLEIINDVLHLSKIESGQESISEKLINKTEFIRRIESYFPQLAQNKGLKFYMDFGKDLPEYFIADENRIMQVINNLVGNAIKFTNQGWVSLKCEVLKKEKKIRIQVTDTGEGIDKKYHERIFEEFGQVDNSRTRESGGTGLGLTISKKIVGLLGGEMGVESQPGKGSTFWFTFIYKNSTKKENTPRPEKPVHEAGYLKDLNVLIVEDKKINQMVVKLMLQELGCKTSVAENGKVAIDLLQKNNFDIILMDIQMPVMDGVTAVKKIRSMPVKQPIIIGLSAEAMEGDAEKYIALGMDDYLTKPIEQETLFNKLHFFHQRTSTKA